MRFTELQKRLIVALQSRLRNGELTERRLARLTGISQPHIHNVLRGKRTLSFRYADLIQERACISLLELLGTERTEPHSSNGCLERRLVEVPVLAGWLGPGLPLPRENSPVESYPFPGAHLASVERPLLARLAEDPEMRSCFRDNDLVLLDHSLTRRTQLRRRSLYLVNRAGEGLIRFVTCERDDLLLLWGGVEGRPEPLPLGWSCVSDVIRARVAWVGRFLDAR